MPLIRLIKLKIKLWSKYSLTQPPWKMHSYQTVSSLCSEALCTTCELPYVCFQTKLSTICMMFKITWQGLCLSDI